MSDEEKREMEETGEEKQPWLKRLLDNPWILLLLGFLVPTLSYTVWGLIEFLSMSPAKLP